jgi:hypothetical protein
MGTFPQPMTPPPKPQIINPQIIDEWDIVAANFKG